MRQRSWLALHIEQLYLRIYPRENNRCRDKQLQDREAGSIALEASIIVPLFLMFVIAVVLLIRTTSVQMGLQSSSVQLAKQVATHWKPIQLASDSLEQKGSSQTSSSSSTGSSAGSETAPSAEKLSGWREIAADAASKLPEPIGKLSSAALRGDWDSIEDFAISTAGRSLLTPVLRELADQAVLQPERLSLHNAVLPSLSGGNNAYVELVAEYQFPIRIPISNKSFVLREKAVERAWQPDPIPAHYTASNDAIPIQIISVQPDPVHPGRKATVVVRTNPNTELKLSIRYKSGYSQAKNVGTASSDANGYLQWTWLVSGNTTPGIWRLDVTAAGGSSAGRTLAVEKIKS
ncbi:hypothetical protein H8B09_00710 [Paenibacillus sp. PR3]|uniref:TadE-like protein n=1 Tax=Paenibacillus terricola TaxID=2763503 RepID=A0ABR8MML2_9BACL|nr:hypothetical protein [Paenibacillus terricola]MBD3917258.1 hypothetical protein [Paenibacillus terricola]